MSNWYLYEGDDATSDELWLLELPPMSVYFDAGLGWCWFWWGDNDPNEIVDSAEGFDSAQEAMSDADRAVKEAV